MADEQLQGGPGFIAGGFDEGAAGIATAGSLHPIPTARVYDSRKNMAPMANGPLATGANRLISVADKRDPTTGTVVDDNIVPVHATAVAYNLTGAGSADAGFLQAFPAGVARPDTSTVNFSAGGQDRAAFTLHFPARGGGLANRTPLETPSSRCGRR